MQAAEADQRDANNKSNNASSDNAPAAFATRAQAGALEMELSGCWLIGHTLPGFAELRAAFEKDRQPRWSFKAGDDLQWDSQCMARVYQCAQYCAEQDVEFDASALPEGMQKLLTVATAVKSQASAPPSRHTLAQRLVAAVAGIRDNARDFLKFIGELSLALLNLLRGRANMRLRDFFYFVEQCGPQAIGIVALISVLVGMILAYLGSVQLRQFGAEVYVANLVTIGMMREMGALMTAVIMAGRTGAAYAAQLGAMQANEEIDAITTLGISPMEYLVLPRFLSLLMVMPLLCIFADVLGLIGGSLVASGMDVNFTAFFHQAREAVHFDDIAAGLIKSFVFAALIAVAGCQAGLQSGRSSAAVGQATTRAVVNAIVYLVIADAGLNILYDKIGF
jgi:phospholipid/cholesterol/gamma-HCH transport system permease protein